MTAQPGRVVKFLPSLNRAHSALQAFFEHIAFWQLQPGARLPTKVCEAVRKLQAFGIVEICHRSGTYLVRTISANTIHIPLTIEDSRLRDRLLQAQDVRWGLEGEASARAALQRTPDDLASLFYQLLAQRRKPSKRFWHQPFDRPDFAHQSFPFRRELFNDTRSGEAAMMREKTLAILDILEEHIMDSPK